MACKCWTMLLVWRTKCFELVRQKVCHGNAFGKWTTGIFLGINSWGYGCGLADTYTVYTQTSYFVPWINEIINSSWYLRTVKMSLLLMPTFPWNKTSMNYGIFILFFFKFPTPSLTHWFTKSLTNSFINIILRMLCTCRTKDILY